jgi:hypothetical protein
MTVDNATIEEEQATRDGNNTGTDYIYAYSYNGDYTGFSFSTLEEYERLAESPRMRGCEEWELLPVWMVTRRCYSTLWKSHRSTSGSSLRYRKKSKSTSALPCSICRTVAGSPCVTPWDFWLM